MDFSKYKEDEELELPNVDNGVTKIGDLWDCQSSRSLGINLFDENLDEKYFVATPIPSEEFRLDHLKTTEDKLKALYVNDELSLELLAGFIKITGSASFDDNEESEEYYERLTCRYYMTNFCVDLLPQAKEALNQLVVNQLIERKIKATHVVKRVIIGADVDVSISIQQMKNEKKNDVEGSFFEKIVYGPIDSSVEATLKWLDSSEGSKYDKKIVMHSKPPLPHPTSIGEMFEIIDDIDIVVAKQYFKRISEHTVTGVPIRYILVPISHYLDVPINRLYAEIKEEIITELMNMLTMIRNFREKGCIRSRIYDIDNRFVDILYDKQSNLSIKITDYEKSIISHMSSYFNYAMEALKSYKVGKIGELELLNTVHEFEKSFSIINTFEKINEFVTEGRNETFCIHSADTKQFKDKLTFFNNKQSMDEWFRTEGNVKIMLKTGGDFHDGVLWLLYNASENLTNIGVSVGVAYRLVDPTFSLSIKLIGGQSFTYKDRKEIVFVLKIISTSLDKRTSNDNLFYNIYTQLTEMEFMLNETTIKDVHNLVSLLNNTRNIIIAKSELDTRQLLRREDNRWKFFVSLDAIDTAVEAVYRMNFLLSEVRRNDIDWIVGKVNICGFNSAPLLFVMRNAKVRAICTDYLDILILVNIFNTNNTALEEEEYDFSLLTIDSLINTTFYSDRVLFAEEFVDIFSVNQREYKHVVVSVFTKSSLEKTNMNDALDIIRFISSNQYIELISCIARIACRNDNNLLNVLLNYGWDDNTNSFRNELRIEWHPFSAKLQDWLMSVNPILAKVNFAYNLILVAIQSGFDENEIRAADEAIDTIRDDIDLQEDIKNGIKDWDEVEPRPRLNAISQLLAQYLNKIKDDNYFHICALIDICNEMSKQNSLQNIKEIGRKYIDRIPFAGIYDTETKKIIDRYFDKRYFYQIIKTLIKCANSDAVNIFNRDIEEFTHINDEKPFKELLNRVCGCTDYNELQLKYLWQNKRFQYLINTNLSEDIIESLAHRIKSKPILDAMPTDIVKKMQDSAISDSKLDMLTIIEDLIDLKRVLKYLTLLKSSDLPRRFLEVLNDSIIKNPTIKLTLENAGSMKNWNEEGMYFSQPWDLNTVEFTLKYLNQPEINDSSDQTDHDKVLKNDDQIQHLNLNITLTPIGTLDEVNDSIIVIDDSYHKVMGSQFTRLMPKRFVQMTPIHKPIKVCINEMNGWAKEALPYIIQRIKMWGGSTLLPDNITQWIQDSVHSIPNLSHFGKRTPRLGGPSFRNTNSTITQNKVKTFQKNTTQHSNGVPLSRLDLITCLLFSVDMIVAQDLLRIMSKFPMSLPLVIQDITKKDKSFIAAKLISHDSSRKKVTRFSLQALHEIAI